MTREEANQIVNKIWEKPGPTTNSIIKMLVELGLLTLEEPKQSFTDAAFRAARRHCSLRGR